MHSDKEELHLIAQPVNMDILVFKLDSHNPSWEAAHIRHTRHDEDKGRSKSKVTV